MNPTYVTRAVRHWTLEEIQQEIDRLDEAIEATGMSVREIRFRESEWQLDPELNNLLRRYERFQRMATFAREGVS